MARYVKQPNQYSCGPTAILNALKWAGLDVTLQHHPLLEFSCRAEDSDDDEFGILDHDFDRVLRWAGKNVFTVRRSKTPTLEVIREHLKNGGSVCLGYSWTEELGGHYAFIAGLDRGLFMVINDHIFDKKRRTAKTIQKWLSNKTSDAPIAWFLTRKKDPPASSK